MGPERGSEARCLEVKTDFGRLTRIIPTTTNPKQLHVFT